MYNRVDYSTLRCMLCGERFECLYTECRAHLLSPVHLVAVNIRAQHAYFQELTNPEFEDEIAEYLADEDILPEQIQQLMPFLKYLNGRNDY